MSELIRFEHVSRQYGEGEKKFYALHDVNFEMNQGEYVVILGPSGAGKSTLLNLLGGMDQVTSGEVVVAGENIEKYNDAQLTDFRADKVGFVFQFYNLIPTLTALENVSITKDIKKSNQSVEKIFQSVHLDRQKDQFPSELSGGEQQRVSIARAIYKDPLMLLCDEPTGALDSKTGVDVLKVLYDLCKRENKTVIIVTHNATIAQTADRVIHLKNGEIEKVILNEKPLAFEEVDW